MNARADVEIDAFSLLYLEGLDAYRPDPPFTVSEWSDEHRVLSSVASAEPGRWRTKRTPFLREIMDCLSSYTAIEMVAVMKGAQLGVSETALNFIGYAIHHSPGPALYVMPSLDMMKKISKTRVDPMIKESPALSDRIKPARARDSGNTTLSKDFDGGTLLMTGANSASSLRSMPIRYLVLDEADGYPTDADDEGDPATLAIKRTSTFVRRKIFMLSTPTLKATSRIGKAFRDGDQRYYNVRCDKCQTLQPIRWSQIRWESGRPETAAFVCSAHDPETGELCEHRHAEHRKAFIMAEENGACWIPTAEAKRPGYRSYHLSALYSPWFTWEEAVREFLAADGDPALLQVFVNTVLGEEWDDLEGKRIEPDSLLAKREDYQGCPPWVALLTAGVDVQPDRLEVEVVGWGRGEESASIDYQVIPGDTSGLDVWDQLDDFLARRWPHAGFEHGMGIAATAVDTGGSNTQSVYRYVRPREGRRIWGIKGVGGKRPVWPRRPSRNNKGKINLFAIGVDAGKETVMNRLSRVGVRGAGACHFPMDRDEEYFAQLTAEVMKTRHVKGHKIIEWHQERDRNEALDCRVYAYAALQGLVMAGLALKREAETVEARVFERSGGTPEPWEPARAVPASPEALATPRALAPVPPSRPVPAARQTVDEIAVDDAEIDDQPATPTIPPPRRVMRKQRRTVISSPFM